MKILSKLKKVFGSHKYSMKIFIDNWGFENKGDQLMIQSVLDQIRIHRPDAQVLLRKNVFMQNPTYCINNKIYPLELKNTGLRCSKLYSWIVNKLLNDDWINTPRDVDLILDCCGYHIADHWIKDESYVDFFKHYYQQFNKKNRRLILLPQAFGPFCNDSSKNAMLLIYKEADCIYARDNISYEYIKSLVTTTDKVRIAPDFTCLCSEANEVSVDIPKGEYVVVVPNSRMIDKTETKTSNSYVDFLVRIIDYLQDKGEKVCLLNHEGSQDAELIDVVNIKIKKKVLALKDLSGIEIKEIIKDCKLLISSRFHGVVSGLTQGVPTLCAGWSHKYEELSKEHGCENSILYPSDINQSIKIINEALITPDNYVSRDGCNELIEDIVRDMWDKVFNN